MLIRITQTFFLDPADWALEYGLDRKDVREDAIAHLKGQIREIPVVTNGLVIPV